MKPLKYVFLIFAVAAFFGCNNDDDSELKDNSNGVVINELLPKNSRNGSDQDGEFDDWIELYNNSDQSLDISGYYLSDSKKNPTKWKFPAGTFIEAKAYLIVWADADTLQAGLHTNYKLSAEGEKVVLLTPSQELINLVEYPPTIVEQSWARVPNGTGEFKWAVPTFNKSND